MREELLNRFFRYVKIETTAGEEKADSVSNDKILDLSNLMMEELKKFKPEKLYMNKFGTVYARFKGDESKKSIALISHLDTAPSASGKNVNPKVVRYEGKPIEIRSGLLLDEEKFPYLARAKGHDIVVTDGKTLLGGDDKAGVAIIMTAIDELIKENKKRRPVEVIFTTDEEIGIDASHIDLDQVKSTYGYTVDGGSYDYVSTETFTGYKMKVEAGGRSIHPGSAKNKMINAIEILIAFNQALPKVLRPEYTEEKEPFFHCERFDGNEDKAYGTYIIRSFDEKQMQDMINIAKLTEKMINEKLGFEAINCLFKEQYHNMKVILDKQPEIIDEINKVYSSLGINLQYMPVRGGTTGSDLSFEGLPCPNLGTGTYNMHGRFEYVDIYEMNKMVDVVKELIKA